jgi:hypothetical protein
MAKGSAILAMRFSPFYGIVQDGFSRMMEFVESEEFEFVVEGREIKSHLCEAVLISPRVYEAVQSDRTCRRFEFGTDVLARDFEIFLGFIRGREFDGADRSEIMKSLFISGKLSNSRLSYALLASLHSITIFNSGLRDSIRFCDANVDFCASQFFEYSIEELRLLGTPALRAVVSSSAFTVDSEDSLLRSLIGLGSGFFDLLECIEIGLLSEEGLPLFVETIDFEHLTSVIWSKVCCRLKGSRCEGWIGRHIPTPFTSTILKGIPSILNEFRLCKWRLLYRGTIYGFSASAFHQKCDRCAHTVTLILTTSGYIFGGFTPIPWDSSGSYKADPTGKSFVFSLVSPRNAPAHRFPLKNARYAIDCGASDGPMFGNGHDVYIADNSNANTSSYSSLGSEYLNDTGLNGQEVLAGQYYFTVEEIEVFSLDF